MAERKQTVFVTDCTCNGKCSNCGYCCSGMLPLSAKELKTIKAYVKKHSIKEQRHNAASGTDLTCPFRDERNRKCLIYEVRPAICRAFNCNQSLPEMERNKARFNAIYDTVFMRAEFFGNTEDQDWFRETINKILL